MLRVMATYTIPRPSSGDVVELILTDHRLFESLMRDMRDINADRGSAREAFAHVLIAHGEAEEEKNDDSSSEDNEEGMDLDLDEGMHVEEDEDTNSTAVSEK